MSLNPSDAPNLPGAFVPIFNRTIHFLGTSPDEAHNRRRMIFLLVCLFCFAIAYELGSGPNKTVVV